MSEFVIALPLPFAPDKAIKELEQLEMIRLHGEKELYLPQLPCLFSFQINETNSELLQVLQSSEQCTEEELKTIETHQSLLFIWTEHIAGSQIKVLNQALSKLINITSALYIEHIGMVWGKDLWQENWEDASTSAEPYLQVLQNKKGWWGTLGMEAFQAADLMIRRTHTDNPDWLIAIADAILESEGRIKAGGELEDQENGRIFSIAKAQTPLFKTSDEHYNRRGYWALTPKSR